MASTLIFVSAAAGNWASYINWKQHAKEGTLLVLLPSAGLPSCPAWSSPACILGHVGNPRSSQSSSIPSHLRHICFCPTAHATPCYSAGEEHSGWYYDVDKVGGSFGIFYGYVGVVGLVLYLVLRWFKAGVPLAAVWCVYGEWTQRH